MDLNKLFDSVSPKCTGCSILTKPLSKHSIMDYEFESQKDLLFVSDSLKLLEGDYVPFRVNEWNLIMREVRKSGYTEKAGFTSSIKCPHLKKDDVSAKDRKICRSHLEDTILKFKPKLVFACGDMATNMIHGKNTKMTGVRGRPIDMEMGGHQFKVVTLYHPYQVIAEPKNAYLFSLDIVNNIKEVLLGIANKTKFTYIPVFSLEELNEHAQDFIDTTDPVSLDIEATGLNFLEDRINTIALSILDPQTLDPKKTIAFPIDHKTANMSLEFKAKVCEFVASVMRNKNNRKVGQSFKFDMKFLMKYGITEFYNVWDTKLMQHMYNEDVPKALSDLVRYHFPNEI